MNNNAGYQPAGQTTVVMVDSSRMRGPQFLRQGVRVGGIMLALPCVICMGMFGCFFLFSSTIMLATANYNDDFWDKFDRDTDPSVIVGSIFLVVGIVLVAASVGVCIFAHKKYKTFQGDGITRPGRVINSSPPGGHQGQFLPAGYSEPSPPQLAGYVQPQPAGYGQPHPISYGQHQHAGYGQPQPAGYGHPQPVGYGQPFGYPDQPQPAGYPAQPPINPAPTSYPGSPPPNPQPTGGYATQPNQPYPEKRDVTNLPSEYTPPPPTVPNSSSQPPPYQP